MNKRSLLSNMLRILAANFWVTLIGFAGSFVFPKILSIESYAFYQTFMLYQSYCAILHLGFASGMTVKYAGTQYETIDKSQYKTEITIILIILAIFTIVALIFYGSTGEIMWRYIAFAIYPVVINGCYKAFYQAWGKFEQYSILHMFLATSVPILAIICFAILGEFSGELYVNIFLVVYWIATFRLLYEYSRTVRGIKRAPFFSKENICLERTGLALTIGNYINVLLVSLDKQFVSFFFSVEEFAFYSFGISMQSIMTVFITSISQPLFPAIANGEIKRQDINKIKEMLLVFGSLSGCAFFVVMFIVQSFIKKYVPALEIVGIYFLVFPPLAVINCLYINLYKIRKKINLYIKTLMIVFIIACILNGCSVYFLKNCEGVAGVTVVVYYFWLIISGRHFEEINITIRDYFFLGLFIIGFEVVKQIPNVVLGCLCFLLYDILAIVLCYRKNISKYIDFYKKLHSADSNRRFCGAKRTRCGASGLLKL